MIKSLINNKKNKKRKAFTLIELIIVICIIAILATIAIPKFLEINENAKVKSDISNAQSIANATSTLIAEEKISIGSTGLNIDLSDASDTNAKAVLNYIDNTPKVKSNKDDKKGKDYYVVVSSTGNVVVHIEEATGIQVYPTPSTGTYAVK